MNTFSADQLLQSFWGATSGDLTATSEDLAVEYNVEPYEVMEAILQVAENLEEAITLYPLDNQHMIKDSSALDSLLYYVPETLTALGHME